MTANKEKIIHFSLLILAAVAVLWYLLRRSSAASAPVTVGSAVVNPTGAQNYPAVPASIKLGDVNIQAAPAPYLNYNAPPSDVFNGAEVGDGPNGCGCGYTAGSPVNIPTVTPAVAQSALDNYNSYLRKVG